MAPPVTADGHGVMALGQVAVGLALGVVLGLLLTWFHFRKLKPSLRAQVVWVALLFLALW